MEAMDEETESNEDPGKENLDPGEAAVPNSRSKFPVLEFLNQRQTKWQRDLHQQQIHIYQEHTMLN